MSFLGVDSDCQTGPDRVRPGRRKAGGTVPFRRQLCPDYRGFLLTSIIPGLALRSSRLGLARGPRFQGRPGSPTGSTRPTRGSVASRCRSSSREPCSSPHRLERFHVSGSGAWTKSRASSRAWAAPSARGGCQSSSGAGWSSSSFPAGCLFSGHRGFFSPPAAENDDARVRNGGGSP